MIKDFCANATYEQINQAAEYNRLSGEAASHNNLSEYNQYFRLYHDTILEGCKNEILVSIIRFRQDLSLIRFVASALTQDELLTEAKKREEVLEACRERDSVKAQRLIKRLIRWEFKSVERNSLKFIKGI
jgi:DNA-binding GntR family transcriptional regulator